MENIIGFKDYFRLIRKKKKIILFVVLISTIISAVLSFYILPPIYQSSSRLIVNGNIAKEKTMTYKEIINSRDVLDKVIKNLNLEITYDDLYEFVDISCIDKTQIIKINVEYYDPVKAMEIAKEIPLVFKDEVFKITGVDNVEVIDNAKCFLDPIKPNKGFNICVGVILGLIIGICLVFLIECLDTRIKSPKDIQKNLELQVLGVIPHHIIKK